MFDSQISSWPVIFNEESFYYGQKDMENAIESKDNSFLSLDSLHNSKDERKNSQEYSKSHSKKCEAATKEKHLTGFLKQSFRTLSVPKKSQTEKGE